MRRALLRNVSLYARILHFSHKHEPKSVILYNGITNFSTRNVPRISCFSSRIRYFSSEIDVTKEAETNRDSSESSVGQTEEKKQEAAEVQDVSNKGENPLIEKRNFF